MDDVKTVKPQPEQSMESYLAWLEDTPLEQLPPGEDPSGRAVTDQAFRDDVRALMTAPRQVTAIARFRGGPGRETEAAEAWAFELTCYFTRGVSERPEVTYENGVYTCTGLMQTTHPGDREITDFTPDEPWALDFALNPGREKFLRETYPQRGIWYDGRDHG